MLLKQGNEHMEIDKGKESANSNQSVQKVFKIIETMAKYQKPIRLKHLAELTELNNVTVFRFLNTLISCGYVAQDSTSSLYFLTGKLCQVSSQVNNESSLRHIALPYMAELESACQEVVGLVVRDGNSARYIETVKSVKQQLSVEVQTGKCIPLHATAAGKLFISNHTFWKLGEYYDTHVLESYTEHTITSRHILGPQLRVISNQGYATEDEEYELGIRSVASPIFSMNGSITAAINIVGPKIRITDDFLSEVTPLLISAAEKISKKYQEHEQSLT